MMKYSFTNDKAPERSTGALLLEGAFRTKAECSRVRGILK